VALKDETQQQTRLTALLHGKAEPELRQQWQQLSHQENLTAAATEDTRLAGSSRHRSRNSTPHCLKKSAARLNYTALLATLRAQYAEYQTADSR